MRRTISRKEFPMNDSFKKRGKAQEDSFFEKQNKEALARLKEKGDEKPRISPITGEPMERVIIMGVTVDKCKDSGGIWLDDGELEEILRLSKEEQEGASGSSWFEKFVGAISSK